MLKMALLNISGIQDYTVDMIIDSKRIDTMPKLNIYDRMKDYKIPGVKYSSNQ